MTYLLQDAYIDKIASKFGQAQAQIVNTPLSSSFQAEHYTGEATAEQTMAYQQRIGSLLYSAIITRPDIAFAASILGQFSQNPSPQHLAETNHVIAYLYSTRYLAFQCTNDPRPDQASSQTVFQAASDASYADDIRTRRSSQDYLLSLFNSPIAWQASKQKTVTTSTTEAELSALSHTAREVINILRLFSQIGLDIEHKPTIQCDNQRTIGLIQKERPQLTTKLKHVDIHHHWVRQAQQSGIINVHWVPTSEMPADRLIKRLTKIKQLVFIAALSMTNIADKLKLSQLSLDQQDSIGDDDDDS